MCTAATFGGDASMPRRVTHLHLAATGSSASDDVYSGSWRMDSNRFLSRSITEKLSNGTIRARERGVGFCPLPFTLLL